MVGGARTAAAGMLRLALALLCTATPCWAENSLQHLGYQFRLLWPATGDLSPDLIREHEVFSDNYVFCGEAGFYNGETFETLGRPFRGLLLVGIEGVGDARNRSASSQLIVSDFEDEYSVNVHAMPGEVVWYPVAFFPVETNLHLMQGQFTGAMNAMDAAPHALPRIRSGCAE